MRRDAPSELASPSLTRASHARADENGGNSVKGSGYRTLQSFAQKDLGVDGSNEELGILGNSYYGSTTYFDDDQTFGSCPSPQFQTDALRTADLSVQVIAPNGVAVLGERHVMLPARLGRERATEFGEGRLPY